MRPAPHQFRAARAWLGWSRGRVAHEAGVCEMSVGRAERGDTNLGPGVIRQLISAYTGRGFIFIGGEALHRITGVQI